jgi:hypothetical protein
MPLSTCLTLGLAGSVFALAMALATGPSAAQSRFNGQNDVPGAVIIEPDEQKINPDTIPEFPSTGDTSIRPRFYMSPGSRCTELEYPLPGGCEANTLQRDSRLLEPIEGRILPFPLVLPPLPPVALVPPPNPIITTQLPQFVAHPVLPRSLALPLIVKPSRNVLGIHIVFLPEQSIVSRLPQTTVPVLNAHAFSTQQGFVPVMPAFTLVPEPTSAVAGFEAVLAATKSGDTRISKRKISAVVPGLTFLKDLSAAPEISLSARETPFSALFHDVNLSGYRIAHPLRSPLLTSVAREPATEHPGRIPRSLPNELGSYREPSLGHGPLVSVIIAPPRPSANPKTAVKFLMRETTIVQGSAPYAHGVTLSHPTAFALQ